MVSLLGGIDDVIRRHQTDTGQVLESLQPLNVTVPWEFIVVKATLLYLLRSMLAPARAPSHQRSALVSKQISVAVFIGSTLLLRSRSLLSLRLRPLLPDSHQTSLTSRQPKCPIRIFGTLAHLASLHFTDSSLLANILDRQNLAKMLDDFAVLFLRSLNILFRRVESLVLSGFAGEEDQAGAISLETLDVHGDGFLGEVGTARVDRDTNGGGEFAGDTSFLEQCARH